MNKNRVRAIYCIILGLVVLAAGILGAKKVLGQSSFSIIPVVNVSEKDHESGKEEISLNSFKNISIDTEVAEIKIETGDEYKVYYEYQGLKKEDMCPKINVENDTLVIEQKTKTVMVMAGTVNRHCKIVITVPAGTEFDKVDIYTNVGEVTIDGTDANDFSAETDVGDISVSKGIYGSVYIVTDVGDASMFDATADSIDVVTNVGEISISKVVTEKLDCSADVGDVELINVHDGNEGLPHLNLNSDVGNVRVNGQKEGQEFRN